MPLRISCVLRALLCTLMLFSAALALPVEGQYSVTIQFDVSGSGNGDIEVLEYPKDYPGQASDCTTNELDFPPYDPSMSCTVSRSRARDLEFRDYEATDLTEADSQMGLLARTLVGGEPERFDKAVAIAGWIRSNVEYDLGVGDTQESAEWTFYHRVGTCDELSHLFISMALEAGLTARYVAGYVWDGEKWLPHAWAEAWTRYGWVPFDVAFDQFGYVDANHIAVNKGPDGDHNFILIYYFGDTSVDHSFEITRLSVTNATLVSSVVAANTTGNASSLVELRVDNPYPVPMALFPSIVPPRDFDLEMTYPEGPVVLAPGENLVYLVLRVPRIRQGYVYTLPVTVQLGAEAVPLSFRVSGNQDCPRLRELAPYTYDVRGCIDLSSKGQAADSATSGNFMCGQCFYSFEEPSSRKYQLDYPDFCESNCTLLVDIIGTGPYSVKVNGEAREGQAEVYERLEFPLVVGNNTVVVGGLERTIEVRSPPEAAVSQEVDGGEVCFGSNWELSQPCRRLSCGGNKFTLELSYGSVSRSVVREVRRECGLWEQLLEFLSSFWQTK